MSLLSRLLRDERGFFQFAVPAAMGLLGLLKKPGVQQGLGAASQILGGIAGRRAQGRQADISAQQGQNDAQMRLFALLQQQALNQGQLNQGRAQFERDSPNVRFGQAMRGNLAANMQDVQAQVPDNLQRYLVNYSGGLRPSAIGEGGRAAGRQLAGIGSSMMGRDTYEQPQMPTPPTVPGLPQSNWFDKFLSIAGPAAGAIGGLGPLMGGGQQQPLAAGQDPLRSPGLYDRLFG